MREKELCLRLNRIASGEFRPDDLTHLFLALRERTFGVHSIKEVGDFVAHPGFREKGPLTKELKIFFQNFEYFMSLQSELNIDIHKLPNDFLEIVDFSFARIVDMVIMERVGISKKQASHILDRIKKSATFMQNNIRLDIDDSLSLEIIQLCISSLVVKPYLTSEDFWRDFCFVLTKNGILRKSDQSSLKKVSPGILNYTIARMHGTYIKRKCGRLIYITAATSNNNLSVKALSNIDYDRDIYLMVDLFPTCISTKEWCEGIVFPEFSDDFDELKEFWDVPLEVRSDMKLSKIERP